MLNRIGVITRNSDYALGLPRSTYYYKPLAGEPDRKLEIMRKIDHQYTEHPAMGARQMVDYLKGEGFHVGRKLVRRLMALMDITHPNHVWSNISYVAMELCS